MERHFDLAAQLGALYARHSDASRAENSASVSIVSEESSKTVADIQIRDEGDQWAVRVDRSTNRGVKIGTLTVGNPLANTWSNTLKISKETGQVVPDSVTSTYTDHHGITEDSPIGGDRKSIVGGVKSVVAHALTA